MAKRTTTPTAAEPEAQKKRRRAATAATARTANARKTIAAPKSPPTSAPRARKTAPKASDEAAGALPRRRSRPVAEPAPQSAVEPYRAPLDEREGGEMLAEPLDERFDDEAPEQPFAEGAHDAIDPDLRHRMISEAAYHHYIERGYEDGYDLDDWLQAEAEVDHLLLNPRSR